MYLIGIDFGHGETTASFYNTENATNNAERLHILNGDTPESYKVESAVCRNKETGKWQFARDIRDYALPDFTLHFKASMNEITPKNKEAFAAFIKLVFEHILENQPFHRLDPATMFDDKMREFPLPIVPLQFRKYQTHVPLYLDK